MACLGGPVHHDAFSKLRLFVLTHVVRAVQGVAQLRSRESYVLSYDPRTRGALWVLEQLRPERLRGDGDRSACDFREDDSVHAYHRATNADYRGSGFDRGHLAAAANHRWSQRAMDDTFYLSNVAPQVVSDPGRPPDCSV